MSALDRLSSRTAHHFVNVVIDTPSGSASKFKFDTKARCYRLSRLLPRGAVFPYNFGSIPRTSAEDGDPLDVLVLAEAPFFVGCLVEVKLIGVLKAAQRESGKLIRNDRLLGVPVTEVNPPLVEHIQQIVELRIAEIEHFFTSYNEAQGRELVVQGRGGPEDADAALREAERRFSRTKR
jgi:inorganic pyrophosphatase